MPIKRKTVVESPVTETVVTGGRGGFGILGGIIASVVAILLLVWLLNGGLSISGDTGNVDLPEVTVTE